MVLSRYAQGSRNEETRIDINSRLYFYTEVDRHRWGLRYRYTVDINNNPQQTWGRTDYIKGDITGNTWDTIKTQTKTNQLMMGNRKDHIRVRRQRQRKTKSDITPPLPIGASRAVRHRKGRGGGHSGGLKDLETGQVTSRAVPVPGPMADPGTPAAMADPGTLAAMANQAATEGLGTEEAMAERGARAAMEDRGA